MRTGPVPTASTLAARLAPLLLASPALAQAISYDHGIEFVTIGAVGNRAFDRTDPLPSNVFFSLNGRGSVSYEYRIATNEVSTAQYAEFLNAFATVNPQLAWEARPLFWGARLADGANSTNPRWALTSEVGGTLPVGGVGQQMAMRYANWLHNNKGTTAAAFASGAYDTSLFGIDGSTGEFTNPRQRQEGARYFLPTADEWLKAVYYDPNATGANGEPGQWWLQPGGSDERLVTGLPGEEGAETSYGLQIGGGFNAFSIPLGSYGTETPWGLIDASGGASEILETWSVGNIDVFGIPDTPLKGGSYAGAAPPGDLFFDLDLVSTTGLPVSAQDRYSGSGFFTSFRIGAVVPAPAPAFAFLAFGLSTTRRRR